MKEEFHERAKEIFDSEGVIITNEGQRHLGAAIGSSAFRENYVNALVAEWVKEVLSEFAKTDQHASFATFTFGLLHTWSYF